ncbi:MAG: 2-oxoacid:acceptor oxidoreductase subunit alpha [Candidatus Omnitrophota bacterium]|nr:MAG: 2-oxoacid:acceptor oxidoreductase subunit alpha [Candidatus Omnitrophota bacterium]
MEDKDFSILIGGKAGDGIDKAGLIIAKIINRLGLYVYIYRDYPSIIRGGHTFSIIRASAKRISCHKDNIDVLLAINQETFDLHKERLNGDGIVIYNSDNVKTASAGMYGFNLDEVVKKENGEPIMRNTCMLGILCKALSISKELLEGVLQEEFSGKGDINLKIALKGYELAEELTGIKTDKNETLPVLTGNEAIGMGLIRGGLDAYLAYPMTPSSGILHFLAAKSGDFSLDVMHPESEISVMLMACGFAYAGKKVAVGTSGGGFCLMTEGLSFSGIAELPVVVILGQRTGPSTGLPTYTGQTEVHFAINAGHGEFPRVVLAPGDTEEAFYWSALALNLAWEFQIPAIVLSDKMLSESSYNFDINLIPKVNEYEPVLWDRNGEYKRYFNSDNPVSGLSFPGQKGAVIKVNSYEHDEYGITTEKADITESMQKKRQSKESLIAKKLSTYETIGVYGDKGSDTVLLCWGSNKGVCKELAEELHLRMIHPKVLWPFPAEEFTASIRGAKKMICVENNITSQLSRLIETFGRKPDVKILRYDGRPFSLDGLRKELKKVI